MVTIITRTVFPASMWEKMVPLTEKSIPVFEKQHGFKSMEVLKAIDGSGTLTIFKFESLADHQNCMTSSDWEELNPLWEEFLGQDEVQFEFLFTGEQWK